MLQSHNASMPDCTEPSALFAGLFSIEIMAMCPGGSWKPLSEWEELFTAAKLKLESVKAVGCNMHLMCFVKA